MSFSSSTNLQVSARSDAACDSVISTISRGAMSGAMRRRMASFESQSGSSAEALETLIDSLACGMRLHGVHGDVERAHVDDAHEAEPFAERQEFARLHGPSIAVHHADQRLVERDAPARSLNDRLEGEAHVARLDGADDAGGQMRVRAKSGSAARGWNVMHAKRSFLSRRAICDAEKQAAIASGWCAHDAAVRRRRRSR